MKLTHTLIITSLACITAAQGALFQLDFSSRQTQASPWETINGTGTPTGTYSGYTDFSAGDLTVSASNIVFNRNFNNSSGTADFPGTSLDNMYVDMLFRNDITQDIDITIEGLKAGTYNITTHHMTGASLGVTVPAFNLLVTDSGSAGFSQNEGNFSMGISGAGGVAAYADFAPTVVTFEVTSNGTDDVIVRIDPTSVNPAGGTLNWVGLSGLEIETVPEPSSTALLGLGALALISRRRRK